MCVNLGSANYMAKILSRLDLWVVRVKKDGKLGDSRPCWSCISTLKQYGLRRVWYSTAEETIICRSVDEIVEDAYITKTASRLDLKLHPCIKLD